MDIKEVKIQGHEVGVFTDFIKSLDGCKSDGKSHDININGFHIYLYEGQDNGGGILHINQLL